MRILSRATSRAVSDLPVSNKIGGMNKVSDARHGVYDDIGRLGEYRRGILNEAKTSAIGILPSSGEHGLGRLATMKR